MTKIFRTLLLPLLVGCAAARAPEAQPVSKPGAAGAPLLAGDLSPIRGYIKRSWTTLTRSHGDLLAAARDPKLPRPAGQAWPVYLSVREDREKIKRLLAQALPPSDLRQIELRTLPQPPAAVTEHGLLYLPHPYVVPGGRFNEMYGWDSYFILLGLLADGEIARAKALTDNFLYEVAHYGAVLNANRTYYLTRSQPPFLSSMVLAVFAQTRDKAWLAAALPAIEAYHRMWITPPHLAGTTGLARYYDTGEGPAPEVLSSERDEKGRTHYERVREHYRTQPVPDYDVGLFYDRENDRLTDLFYKGDRSMRESGFDPSNRFGPFGVDVIHYAPVCLNVLLHRMENETATIAGILGNDQAAQLWRQRAESRRSLIDRYLWDEQAGFYFDHNFQTGKRRPYQFATTFYPLWAGIASPGQAARVQQNLRKLEQPGGIVTSPHVTGNQWDAPFGWAPLQLIAVEGLRRYGYTNDAQRVAQAFLALVLKEFNEHGTIVEKYDVSRRESDVSASIRFGYSANEIGFGWTNGVFLHLL
jgi:alpha,alpha-trehalase